MTSPMMEILYLTGNNRIPRMGGWITYLGNPFARRGQRVIKALRECGVLHLHAYWAYAEDVQFSYPRTLEKEIARVLEMPFEDEVQTFQRVHEAQQVFEAYVAHLENDPRGPVSWEMQGTWMTIHTPASQLVRGYRGEVNPLSGAGLRTLLANNCLRPISFSKTMQTSSPLWQDEGLRDLRGSLQLDGLSQSEAELELVKMGEVTHEALTMTFPGYYYEPMGWYRANFCEED